MSTIKELAESLPDSARTAIAASYAAPHLIAAKAKAEKEAAMQHLETVPRPTPVLYGTERDYLLYRLNQQHQHRTDLAMADYVSVRKTGMWEVVA